MDRVRNPWESLLYNIFYAEKVLLAFCISDSIVLKT